MAAEEFYVTGLDWVRGTEEPIKSSGRPMGTTSWDEVALDRRDEFDQSLRLAGLSDEAVREVLAVRDVGAAELVEAEERLKPYDGIAFNESPPEYIDAQNFYRERRRTGLQRLLDWWNERVETVESTEPRLVRVPLFLLGTPSTPKCKAKWTNEITAGFTDGWGVQIAGSGFASDAGSTYVESASFEADSGQTKLIYCDIPVQLEQVEIRQKGQPPVRQWRIKLVGDRQTSIPPGLLLLDPDAVPERGEFVKTFPVAGDPSGAPATYSEGYSNSRKYKVKVGLDVKGVKLGLTANSDFGERIRIEYKLKSGIDYHLFYARDCDGYMFGINA